MAPDALLLYSLSGPGDVNDFFLAMGVLFAVFGGAILIGRLADRFFL